MVYHTQRVSSPTSIDGRTIRVLALFTVVALTVALPAIVNAAERLVTVYGENQDDGSVIILADSSHIIPVFVRVDVPQLINMTVSEALPVGARVEPGTVGQELFRISRAAGAAGRVGYALSYSFARGDPLTARHDDDHRYLLPFAHGTKHRLSQGFNGSFSHYGENAYAVDFEMPEGTPVHAARAGMVVEVKADSRRGGPSTAYNADANYILIAHADGSFGNYAHLRFGGVLVEPGEWVEAGQQIGYSGNTGRSTGPHLHFDVRLPIADGSMQSVPFVFQGARGAAEPVEGDFYYAHHPGGEPFVEVFGADLRLSDFAEHKVTITGVNRVDVRVEQIDLTFVLFIQNGLDRDVDVDLSLQLVGLDSDVGNRIQQTVPARTEIFATILRTRRGASRIQYGFTVRYR